jgi:ABC-type nitrate/sulfonate/bicarbonate transport system substrate-binding protein
MKNYQFNKFLLIFAIIGIAFGLSSCDKKSNDEPKPLRLGWQPPWINQGQIVEVFKHTDITTKNHVHLEYKAFSYGGPMTEAALAGELDILFCGDQPAITLIARDSNWRIVARLVNYRSAFLVPSASSAKDLNDLIGRKVAAAFGSTTHRDAVRILNESGLEIGKDKNVEFVNIDQAEHAALISRGGTTTWDGITAIATYDPTIAISTQKGFAKILKEWNCLGVIVVHERIIRERHEELKNFLRTLIDSFVIYANNPDRFNAFYSEDSRLPLPNQIYRDMSACELNLRVSNAASVEILIDDANKAEIQRNMGAALKIGIIKQPIEMDKYIDMSIAREVIDVVKK